MAFTFFSASHILSLLYIAPASSLILALTQTLNSMSEMGKENQSVLTVNILI